MLKLLTRVASLQVACCFLLALRAVADVTVSEVRIVGAERREEPFDQLITIQYRLSGTYDSVDVVLTASQDGGTSFDIPVTTLSGGFGQGDNTAFAPATTDGIVTVTWNLGADWPGEKSDAMKVRVQANSSIGGMLDATSTATSTAFRADTRPIPPLTLKRIKKTTADGRRLITYESAVTGIAASGSPVFFQAALPETDPDGFGVFYGFELVKFSDSRVKLYQAIGRAYQDSSRQDLIWKPTSFDTLIRIPLNGAVQRNQNIYFKIVRTGTGGKYFRIRLKAKFACFYDQKGKPIAQLDPQKNIVLVFHGRGSGEKNSREINAAMRLAGDTEQVISVDWSSGAASSGLELTGGRYLKNLGGALRERLAAEDFERRQITTIGHSWGALLSHEVATAWSDGVSRMYVIDPAPAADGYNEKRVNFGLSGKCGHTYGIKGGNRNDGVFGSPNMTRTCQYAVNVLSNNPPSNLLERWSFYHDLPVAWFIRAVSGGQSGIYSPDKAEPYWDYLRSGILSAQYVIPPEIGRPISAANEFNLVCNGNTSYSSKSNESIFDRHTSFEFKLQDLGWRHVILQKKPNADIFWKFLNRN